MATEIETIAQGTVTTPRGFQAGAARVDVRPDTQRLDLAILYSEAPCQAAAVYTRNRVRAAPLLLTEKHLADGRAQAVVANSGCANAATGERGLQDALEMARLTGVRLGIAGEEVGVASTGVIGTFLPMDRIGRGIERVHLSPEGGMDFARAIMTTDTRPKHLAIRFGPYTLGGVAKGAGMIHPNMATMLCFITTDAPVSSAYLNTALKEAVDSSFNMIDVDSDTSTNDMVLVLANGLADGEPIEAETPMAAAFAEALAAVCAHLAKAIVTDAEGSTKFLEARVIGASSLGDARKAAREVVRSLAVKTAVYGQDANWGRILAAVGNSGCEMDEAKTALYLAIPEGGELCLFRSGSPLPYDEAQAKACLAPREVAILVDLGLGEYAATAWGSDITENYVRLNSQYTT